MNEINNIFNKHNYLGEHRGKANILLTSTIEDEFSITLEDEQNEVKSSWEMTMHREDAEKVIRKAAEMLGVIPIYDCRSCKNNGNERECVDCHDFCNFVRYEERQQGECEKCDFRKFSEKFADCVAEAMYKNGITSVEQLSEMLKGGEDS